MQELYSVFTSQRVANKLIQLCHEDPGADSGKLTNAMVQEVNNLGSWENVTAVIVVVSSKLPTGE